MSSVLYTATRQFCQLAFIDVQEKQCNLSKRHAARPLKLYRMFPILTSTKYENREPSSKVLFFTAFQDHYLPYQQSELQNNTCN